MPEKNDFAGRYIYHEELDKIIAEAVQVEREACAMECDNIAHELDHGVGFHAAIQCEGTIRARSK